MLPASPSAASPGSIALPDQIVADPAFRSPLPLLNPASIAIVGASERAKWATQIFGNLRAFGYPGKVYPVNPRLSRGVGQQMLPGSRRAAGAAPARLGDRAGRRRAGRAGDRRQGRAQERHHLCEPDRRRRGPGDRGARHRPEKLDRSERPLGLRAQLHGRQCAAREMFRLSQHRTVRAHARLGRHGHAVGRHAAISRPGRSAARGEVQLHDLERQRDQSRSRRLRQFPGR